MVLAVTLLLATNVDARRARFGRSILMAVFHRNECPH
eukprot:SAG31_NODE_37421_length_304_cov_1.000000_1_plen_36_part_10